MPFGTATISTNKMKAILADRLRQTPATYTNSPHWVGHGTGATAAARTAAVGDTALSTEADTRAVGTESTVTTTVTGDTHQVVGTISVGGTRAIDEAATFDQLAAGGNIGISATFPVINLVNGESIQYTMKEQLT